MRSGRKRLHSGTWRSKVEAETALSEERNLLRTLVDALPDIVYVKDTHSRYVLANTQCLQHLGTDNSLEVLGRTSADFLPAEEAERARQEEKDIIKSERPIIGEERKDQHPGNPDGQEEVDSHRWYAVTKIPWRDHQGKVAGTIGLHRDITHYKEAAENIITLSQMLIQAQETEQQRMALELHDNVAQDLAALRISWDLVSAKLRETSTNPILQQAERFSNLLSRCIQTVRNLSHDLSPVGLHERSLVEVVSEFCEEYAKYHDIEVETHFAGVGKLQLPDEVKINLFRITQEAFNNTRRHANATRIELKIVTTPRRLILDISDNGLGFHPQSTMQRAIQTHHMGLYSIQQRAKLIGAKSTIRSAIDKGTRVRIEMPLEEANLHD